MTGLPALLAWPEGTKTQTGRAGTVVSELRLGELEQLCLNSDWESWNSCVWTQTGRAGTAVSGLRRGDLEQLCLNSD